jgi:hypothetical protein
LSNRDLFGKVTVMADPRGERLQIMLTKDELTSVDNWRFSRHMPSRASAVRELLRRGLDAEGFTVADGGTKSGDYGVMAPKHPLKNGKTLRG